MLIKNHELCFIWIHLMVNASYCMLQAILQGLSLRRCISKKY